ncbi:hypothetical protein [Caulobacter sp. 17J65-9]|uniref:hypothetical protein n=1 Tax=Caulobacter sp. 17J65-9 TaxID=2709382 RepID=UPI0013CB321A|nr:hypothetical protein [Caulobacter sp. 17J65-9]NEX95223.1 hypothetical protein [Caulobacter sp. 17J65-9]
MRLEDIRRGMLIAGVVPGKLVSVVAAEMNGDTLEVTYRVDGALGQRLLSRADEAGVLPAGDPPSTIEKWRRLAEPRFVLPALLVIALAFGALSLSRHKTAPEPAFTDTPVVIRTNGGLLEVVKVRYPRPVNLTNMFVVLGIDVPFCKEHASYTVDAHITYRVRLAKHWSADYRNQRLFVKAPKLEPATPVAFDTRGLKGTLSKCALAPGLGTQADLLRRVSSLLEADAKNPKYVDFARDHGARDTVREFVQKWLITQKGYDIPPNTPIEVEFDGE